MRIISTALMLAGIGLSWLVMIYGWGLEPRSWLWVFFGTLAAIFLVCSGMVLGDKGE